MAGWLWFFLNAEPNSAPSQEPVYLKKGRLCLHQPLVLHQKEYL